MNNNPCQIVFNCTLNVVIEAPDAVYIAAYDWGLM